MKNVSQLEDDKLLDYLDGNLSGIEAERIEDVLAKNPSLRARLEELRFVNSMLQEPVVEQPSRNFSAIVMQRLDQYPVQSKFSVKKGILLLAGFLLAVGIAIAFVASGTFDNSITSIDFNHIELTKKIIKTPLPTVGFSSKLLVNIIIVLNLGLAWLVLDRAILKPFFQKRMQSGH